MPATDPEPNPEASRGPRAVGWHPDPTRPGQQIYWNGAHWTRGQLPLADRRAHPVGRRFRLAAGNTQALLVVDAVASTAWFVGLLGVASRLAGTTSGAAATEAAEAAGRLLTARALAGSALVIATAVSWWVWQVILAKSDIIHVGDLRRSRVWQVASWLVPVVCLWFPLQNVADLDAASRAPRDALGNRLDGIGSGRHAVRPGPAGLLWAWWLAFVLSLVLERLAGAGLGSFAGVAQLRSAITLTAYASVVEAVAAVLAVLVVRRITTAAWSAGAPAPAARHRSQVRARRGR